MKLTDFLKEDLVLLDDVAHSKEEIIHHLVELSKKTGQLLEPELFEKNVLLREKISTTGLGHGVAIPHSKDRSVKDLFCVFIRTKKPIDFDAIDGEPVNLFFMIGSPVAKATGDYLKLLARVSLFANDEYRRARMREAKTPAEFMQIINEFEGESPEIA